MQEAIQIKQELTLTESIRFSLFLLSRMRIMQRIFLLTVIVGIVDGISSPPFFAKHSTSLLLKILNCIYVPLALILFFVIFICLSSIVLYKLKPSLFKEVTYRFTWWGMEKFNDKVNYTAAWRQFTGYKETKKFIYLFLNRECHPIKKGLLSHNEITSILSFVQGASSQ